LIQSLGFKGANPRTYSIEVNPYLLGVPVSLINSGLSSPLGRINYFPSINYWCQVITLSTAGVLIPSIFPRSCKMHRP
jgi:hypothetical protein